MRLLLCASTAALILGAAPIGALITPAEAQVAVTISASIAPPLLPVCEQPPIPGPGCMWIPGYWAWDGSEYYWTPGYWATPPAVGLYWTPPYWAWNNGVFVFNAGYWGPTVGFYGGINYGFGYTGYGHQGGFWRNNAFVYNRTVNNFGNVNIANSYSQPVPNPNNHVAFNGGNGGTTARPTQAQIAARAHGTPPTAEQTQHQEVASRNLVLGFKTNHGNPSITAMQRANEFHGAQATTRARPQAAPPAPAVHPQVGQHPAPAAPAARAQVAQHPAPPAPAARPEVARHAAPPAPAARPQVAQHAAPRAPAPRPQVVHMPAMPAAAPRPEVAQHAAPPAPAPRPQVMHAPAMPANGRDAHGSAREPREARAIGGRATSRGAANDRAPRSSS
jgi:hypothetical protein